MEAKTKKLISGKIEALDKKLGSEILVIMTELTKGATVELAGSRSRGIYFDVGDYRKYKSDFDIYVVKKINFPLPNKKIFSLLKSFIKESQKVIQAHASDFKHFPGMSKIRSHYLGVDMAFLLEVNNKRYVLNNTSGILQESNAIEVENIVAKFVVNEVFGKDVIRFIKAYRGLLRINERRYPKGVILDALVIINYVDCQNVLKTLTSTLKKMIIYLENMKAFEIDFFGHNLTLNYQKKDFLLFSKKLRLFIKVLGEEP